MARFCAIAAALLGMVGSFDSTHQLMQGAILLAILAVFFAVREANHAD